ncbi:MAG: hypothetical protein VX712_04145 [Bacteroidota bacterium]|nr:hypothetical protein [Bacteroidota bacterium]
MRYFKSSDEPLRSWDIRLLLQPQGFCCTVCGVRPENRDFQPKISENRREYCYFEAYDQSTGNTVPYYLLDPVHRDG